MAEENAQEQETPEEHPASREVVYEVKGAGFLPGIPGEFANCRVIVEDEKVTRIEPLGDFAQSIVLLPSQQPASQQKQPEAPDALQTGGVIKPGGFVIIGEPGPETSWLPNGAVVKPSVPNAPDNVAG